MKKQLYRHGEIIFVKIKSLPANLQKSETNTFLIGGNGNSHTFKGGELYLNKVNEYVFGYFRAKDTKLFHCEHSPKGVSIKNGIYELRVQNEYTAEGLKQIID